jgi:transglutaminase-like putative cysteine protease
MAPGPSIMYCELTANLAISPERLLAQFHEDGRERGQSATVLHQHIQFDYQRARATRTALEAFRERVGVCRDFTHLAVTFSRCMTIPARYVTGYLGDIGIPRS